MTIIYILRRLFVTELFLARTLNLLNTEVFVDDSRCGFIQLLDWGYVAVNVATGNVMVGFALTSC